MFQTVAIAEFACFNRVRAHRIFVWWLRSFLRQNSLSNKSRSIFTQHILLTGLGETASSASQYSRREHRFFYLVWSDASWPAVQNFTHDAPFLKTLPEGFGLVEMYTSTRNKIDPYIPTVLYAGENYWPVKIRHYSNGKTKWIYIHEDEPSVKSFLEETRASERARESKAENF